MRKFITLLPVLFIFACATQIGQTPGQKLYGALADYSAVQKAGIAYKNNCIQYKTPGCDTVVKKIKAVNQKADATIKASKIGENTAEYTDATRLVLLALTDELRSYLTKGNVNE